MIKSGFIGYKILRLALVLALIYSVLTGLATLTLRGAIDFPCPATYAEEDDCILLYTPVGEGDDYSSQIEIFLTSYAAGFSGGGCNHKRSETNVITVQTFVRDLSIVKDGSLLRVDGKVLERGEKFLATNAFHINPWVISRLKFVNLGLVPDCQSGSQHHRVVILGSYGTEISLLKGLLISSAIVCGIVFCSLKLSRLKAHVNLRS